MPEQSDKLTYNIPEACQVLGVSRNTLYRMMADGRLVARKIGSRTVILVEDLRHALENLPAGEWK